MKLIAPNINLYVYRPAFAQPALCSWLECERITLSQLLDMHEALDLRAALAEQAVKARQS